MATQESKVEGVTDEEDIILDVTMKTYGDISTWTLKTVIVNLSGVTVTKTLGSGITIIVNGDANTKGNFQVVVTAADLESLAPGDSTFEIWRTNSGAHARLVYGPIPIASTNIDLA